MTDEPPADPPKHVPPSFREVLFPEKMRNLAEDHIHDAIQRGDFDNLPGSGKPLNLEADRLVPPEYRLAYRIMRDNEVQPEWIMLQNEIDTLIQAARHALRNAARQYFALLEKYQDKPGVMAVAKRLEARDLRDFAQACFHDQVRVINRKVALLNLKLPAWYLTRDLLDAEREITLVFFE